MTEPFQHIACCIDDSDASRTALRHAAALHALSGGRLSVVHVIAPPPFLVSMAAGLGGASPVYDPDAHREAGEMWLADAASGIEGAEPVLLAGHPGETACDWAREAGVDVIVAATHRGLIERTLVGSFAAFLTRHAPCPLFLIPPGLAEDAR